VAVHHAFGCAQVLYLSIHRVRDPGDLSCFRVASMVLGHGEMGEYISLSTVEG
jgi:hypothetical protein